MLVNADTLIELYIICFQLKFSLYTQYLQIINVYKLLNWWSSEVVSLSQMPTPWNDWMILLIYDQIIHSLALGYISANFPITYTSKINFPSIRKNDVSVLESLFMVQKRSKPLSRCFGSLPLPYYGTHHNT